MQLLFFILSYLKEQEARSNHGHRMHGHGVSHGGLHNTGHGRLGTGHGVHRNKDPSGGGLNSGGPGSDVARAMNNSLAAMNVEQALSMGISPMEAAALQEAQTQNVVAEEGERYGNELAGEVIGGGLTGFNMGGANNPRAATSNAFHSPLEAALHEAGPFGSQSALSANMLDTDDPTVRQRIKESTDTVHDDTLKANLAKKQSMENEIMRKKVKSLEEMNEAIKRNASEAARKDQHSAEMNAELLTREANGHPEQINPRTNRTYKTDIDEQLAIAEHAGSHARNPDLYEFENAAEKGGFPRPTIAKEIQNQALRELIDDNIKEANRTRREARRMEEEMLESSYAAATHLKADQMKLEQRKLEMKRQEKIESDAVSVAEANVKYQAARSHAADVILQSKESLAANAATAAEIRQRKEITALNELSLSKAGEATVLKNAEINAAANLAASNAINTAIRNDETAVAKMSEETANEINAKSVQNQLVGEAAIHSDIAAQKMGEAAAASLLTTAVPVSSIDTIAAAGEQAVAMQAQARGSELAQAAAMEKQIASDARARGADLANAQVQEKAAADEARNKKAMMDIAAKEAEAVANIAEAREKILADAAATEAVKGAAAKEEEGHVALDAYDVLGTIPDDADSVAIANSSMKFPLKTFNAPKARNQAEAGALAAQAKIKDDIRGKITANELDTPLNVIKGEGGYLNVPENAKSVDVDSGRAYFQEAAVAAMEKAGQDTSQLEHRINTGERANMGIGLGYYVANVDGMSLDLPSPSNPDPPAVLSGNGHMIDVSHAEGMDIVKGDLKLEKWEDYSRRVRPTVNANVVTNLRENITESMIDDDCVKNALREADAMYNTKSEIITNPNGESFLKVTPAFGVAQQLPYKDAILNLQQIKKSCNISQGQIGISMMEGKSSSSSKISTKKKSLNIAEGLTLDTQSEEAAITKNALEDASVGNETHSIVTRHNAFDNQIHTEKNEIVNEGARILAEESGTSVNAAEEIKSKLMKEKEELQNQGSFTESTNSEEMKVAYNVKERMLKDASKISKELKISEQELTTLLEKVSMKSIADIFNYVKHSSDETAKKEFEKTKSELRILFGTGATSFEKILMQNITTITGFGDPDEQILIRKETTMVPKVVMSYDKPNSLGGKTTVTQKKLIPVVKTIRIPIRKIIRAPPGKGLLGVDLPVGELIKNSQQQDPNNTQPEFVGSHGINPKIKLGDNGIIIGSNNDIKHLVDPASIGHINDIQITPGEIKRRVLSNGGTVPKRVPHTTNQVREVTVQEKVGGPCIGPECSSPKMDAKKSISSKSTTTIGKVASRQSNKK